MKKLLLVLISALLLAGVAQAAEMNQAISAELSAQSVGRSVATDSSVVLKVWAKDGVLSYPGIGVTSGTAIVVYSNYVTGVGYTINPSSSSYDTIGEIVDYINTSFATDSTVKINASIGKDARSGTTSKCIPAANIVTMGITKDTGAEITNAQSRLLSAGVEAKDGVTPRLKSITAQIPAAQATGVLLAV